jgi:hypothetical protein
VTARGESFRQTVSSDSAVPSASGQVPELITMRIPVTFSPTFFQPFSVYLATSASASALNAFNGPRTAQAQSDYGSTLLWTGVSSVLDVNVLIALHDRDHVHHELVDGWLDLSVLDPAYIDGPRLLSGRQLAYAYLLALAVRPGGRLVTFDRWMPLAAVRGARADQLVVL